MSKLLCVACEADAYYVYLGKSLCRKHFKEWAAKNYVDLDAVKPATHQIPAKKVRSSDGA